MRQKFILDINPSTGELIEKIKCSSSGEIASAIKLARKALKTWSDTPIKSKIAAMKRIAKDLMKEKEELGKLITDEMGKIYKSAVGEVVGTANAILENIKLAEKAFQMEKYQEGNLVTELYRVPIGVVAVITPWNFPVGMPESLLTPAILAGNSVVFKPSELTPLTGKMLYTIYNRHLPKGVINLLLGAGEVGEELVNSEIDMVGFVGSQAVGKKNHGSIFKATEQISVRTWWKRPDDYSERCRLNSSGKIRCSRFTEKFRSGMCFGRKNICRREDRR